jgi:hypothetical protein
MSILKVYIEPASLPLTYQLADYVKNIENPDIYSIIVFERLKLNINNFNNGRTVFIDNVNNNLAQKLDKIAKFIINKPLTGLEIHTNIYRESDILLPLMKRIAPHFALEKIQLHLYDDGAGTLLQRSYINTLDEAKLNKFTKQRRKKLLTYLLDQDSSLGYEWTLVDNYIWHHLTDVKYYLINPGVTLKYDKIFFKEMAPFVIDMHFDIEYYIPTNLSDIWQNIFNIDANTFTQLQNISQDDEATLFLTSYYIDKPNIVAHHASLLEKIAQLKKENKLPTSDKIVFKGHPENKALNDEISICLGKNIITIPDNIPLEYLFASNLLPRKICGTFSSAMFSMPGLDIRFVLMNGSRNTSINDKLLNIAKAYNCFDSDKLIYLNEHNNPYYRGSKEG